jgi:hypothetical protein
MLFRGSMVTIIPSGQFFKELYYEHTITHLNVSVLYSLCLLVSGSVTGNQHTKFLYVNERLPCGPSVVLDNSRSSREPRLNPVAARLHKTKKGTKFRQQQSVNCSLIQIVIEHFSTYV